MQRSAMRELAFKLVYEIEVQNEKQEEKEEQVNLFLENNEITDEKVINYLKDIVKGLEINEDEINNLVTNNLKKNWSLNRISKINLSLIKIAIYEMVYKQVPYKVAINEVVELAKKYADDSAPVFINGILASVVKEKNLNSEE
jgi:N utilization substance protein B